MAERNESYVERRVERDELLTSQEVRSLLKISRTKLWELTRNNIIPAYRIGDGNRASLRYRRSDLMQWLDKNRV